MHGVGSDHDTEGRQAATNHNQRVCPATRQTPLRRKSSLPSDRSCDNKTVERRLTLLTQQNKWHYHIRWLPGDLLDWQPFASSKAANRAAKRMVGRSEIYIIERFSGSCGRCRSRAYRDAVSPAAPKLIGAAAVPGDLPLGVSISIMPKSFDPSALWILMHPIQNIHTNLTRSMKR
jgi:hypothetical protein